MGLQRSIPKSCGIHRQNVRECIVALRRHSKDWWGVNKELLHRNSQSLNVQFFESRRLQFKLSIHVSSLSSFANMCFAHRRATHYWCDRCYISACMVKNRQVCSAPILARRICDNEFTKEERQLMSQLLQLFRSGALTVLLSSDTPLSDSSADAQAIVQPQCAKA